jgi:hypothetical protein
VAHQPNATLTSSLVVVLWSVVRVTGVGTGSTTSGATIDGSIVSPASPPTV